MGGDVRREQRPWSADPARLTLAEQAALAKAPRRGQKAGLADTLGKVWSSPNTAVGLTLGAAGFAAGQINRLRPGEHRIPRVQFGHNAVEFINNPASPLGGLTLGNVTLYGDDPYDPTDKVWAGYRQSHEGHPVQEHEEQHTYQGQRLGPFYLPSNIAGGLIGLARDRDWGGPSNWNERGPKMNPPRPWPDSRR